MSEKKFNPYLYVSMVHSDLTNRELEVLKRVAQGKTQKQIAHEIGVSLKVISSHYVKGIYDKLGVRTIAQVTRIAVAAHLV